MKVKKRRGLLALAAITASVALSGIGAGGAQAAFGTPCSGDTIEGQGSSLQGVAQEIWGTKFKTNMNGGCTTGPSVGYTATSSGRCLATWGAAGGTFNTAAAFCGTDDAPTDAQIETINTTSTTKVLSIPVAQAAIAIVVNPPEGCNVTWATPEQIETVFRGSATTWSNLNGSGTDCNTTITRVARSDSSGTTYQLKHYLGTINGGTVNGTETWTNLQAPSTNQTWPGSVDYSQTGCTMTVCDGAFTSGSGGGDEVRTVGALDNSIGYAALADARSVLAATTYTTLKWLKIGTSDMLSADPSSNGLLEARGTSNCETGDGTYPSLPATTTISWADVYYKLPNGSGKYPICTLTWATALQHYGTSPFGSTTGPSIAQTVKDYLGYVVTTAGGQTDALGDEATQDYSILPTDVQGKAEGGVTEITN
jgi:ABC-type phosphate transport system substrate-binding protein